MDQTSDPKYPRTISSRSEALQTSDGTARKGEMTLQTTSLTVFFISLGVGIALAIGVTCSVYPLFEFAGKQRFTLRPKSLSLVQFSHILILFFLVTDLDWTKQWLITTVVDYYGAAICLCVITLLSEPFPNGILWSIGFLLLGSPVCCLYCAYRYSIT